MDLQPHGAYRREFSLCHSGFDDIGYLSDLPLLLDEMTGLWSYLEHRIVALTLSPEALRGLDFKQCIFRRFIGDRNHCSMK